MEKCNSKLLLIEEINAITSLQHYFGLKKILLEYYIIKFIKLIFLDIIFLSMDY
jgi:hypothetical protein